MSLFGAAFDGKVAVVTAVGSGIGQGVATAFVRSGEDDWNSVRER